MINCSSVHFSIRESMVVVQGLNDTKPMTELMPDILKQVGPQQYSFLKDVMADMKPPGEKGDEADDADDVPPLVTGNFEDASKQWIVEWEPERRSLFTPSEKQSLLPQQHGLRMTCRGVESWAGFRVARCLPLHFVTETLARILPATTFSITVFGMENQYTIHN